MLTASRRIGQMPHSRAEVFWQIPHRRDRQDDKCPGGMGTLGIDWATKAPRGFVINAILVYVKSLFTREYLGYRHLLLTARENELIVILILIVPR